VTALLPLAEKASIFASGHLEHLAVQSSVAQEVVLPVFFYEVQVLHTHSSCRTEVSIKVSKR
jgi:hypothetical protein